jgi:hypothetical protein
MRLLTIGGVLLACACEGLVTRSGDVDAGIMGSFDAGADVDASVSDAAVSDAGTDGGVDAGAPLPADAGVVDAGVPIFMIGGQSARILVSLDLGHSWVRDQQLAISDAGIDQWAKCQATPVSGDNYFSGFAAGEGVLVISGDEGLWRSTDDGLTWSLVHCPEDRFATNASVAQYSNGLFVVVGQGNTYRSTDRGLTWVRTQDSLSSRHFHQLLVGNGHWLVADGPMRKVSEDGFSWHDFTDAGTAAELPFRSYAFGAGHFVAVGGLVPGDGGIIGLSDDGVHWDAGWLATTNPLGFSDVAYVTFADGGSRFVAFGPDLRWESDDGVRWQQTGSHGPWVDYAFAALGESLVLAGYTAARYFDWDAGQFVSIDVGGPSADKLGAGWR